MSCSQPGDSSGQLGYAGTTLPGLHIDTFGTEVAGSGYDWLTAPDALEPYHSIAPVIQAQKLGLETVNDRIEHVNALIESCRRDEQMIAEFMANVSAEELSAARDMESCSNLLKDIDRLENDMEKLHQQSPQSTPPARSRALTGNGDWCCIRCEEDNRDSFYRCRCLFPRTAIDPRESTLCNCVHCDQSKVTVSNTQP